jgi:hypothetical protein
MMSGSSLLFVFSTRSVNGALAGKCFFRACKVRAQEKHNRSREEDGGIFLVRIVIELWMIHKHKWMAEKNKGMVYAMKKVIYPQDNEESPDNNCSIE